MCPETRSGHGGECGFPRLASLHRPATLGVATLVLILLNGPLSSVMANLLPGSVGRWAAGQIPLIAMVSMSLVALGIGLTRPGRDAADTKGQKPTRPTALEGESRK